MKSLRNPKQFIHHKYLSATGFLYLTWFRDLEIETLVQKTEFIVQSSQK